MATRPVLRWHGGKWLLAPWIIQHLPSHRVYVEPFGGAASVLLRKPRAYAEVYNDLHSEVVTLFRVLRDPATAAQLETSLRLTPFARDEFSAAYEPSSDAVEIARRLIVRSFMGFGADSASGRGWATGFRADSNKSGSTPAHDWAAYPSSLRRVVERLQGVVIESRDALAVMRTHDGPDTLHYVDPPYLPETRGRKRGYRHELGEEQHQALLDVLLNLAGKVVLSGYPSPAYDEALGAWTRVERPALADGARARMEVLWINPAAAQSMQRTLWEAAAEGHARRPDDGHRARVD